MNKDYAFASGSENLAGKLLTSPAPPNGRNILGLPRQSAAQETMAAVPASDVSSLAVEPLDVGVPQGTDTPTDALEETRDKFASCEVDAAADTKLDKAPQVKSNFINHSDTALHSPAVPASEPASSIGKEANPNKKNQLELATAQCVSLQGKVGDLLNAKWGTRAAPILEASLRFKTAYDAASQEERKSVRSSLKTRSGCSREPNSANIALIGIYLCVGKINGKKNKAQRKEWSRFATVVNLAASQAVRPADATLWLEDKTLNSIVAEWRKNYSNKDRKPAIPSVLKKYTLLASALVRNGRYHALAAAELSKAEAAIAEAIKRDNLLAESTANAPASTTDPVGVGY